MLYREIIAVCSQIHTKHTNTLCGQNVEISDAYTQKKKCETQLLALSCLSVSLVHTRRIFVKYHIEDYY